MNTTLLDLQSYHSWVEKKKFVIYKDVLTQSILSEYPEWKPHLSSDVLFKISDHTKKHINELLKVMNIPTNPEGISRFLINPLRSVLDVLIEDPLIAQQYIQHKLYRVYSKDIVSKIWFTKSSYWLVGKDAREILALWTRINRILSHLEELDLGLKMQIRFKYNGNIYEASILPKKEPVLVSYRKIYMKNVKTAIISNKGEKYYRDYLWNIYLKEDKELRPFFIQVLN